VSSIVGIEPPFGVTAAAAFIYNLAGASARVELSILVANYHVCTAGFVDVVLFFAMHRAFPEGEALPKFVRRKTVDPSVMQYGITPFAFSAEPKSPAAPQPFVPEPQPSVPEHGDGDEPGRRGSTGSLASINSQTPLRAV
jgi:hypothetical protein